MTESKEKTAARLAQVRLEPAPGAHESGVEAAYEFVAPLDADGRIDAAAWKLLRALCFVHRIEDGEIARRGLLVHRPGGPGGSTWAFDYELGDGDEETGFRFESHLFVPGEYVSIRADDGDLHTFRIIFVKPV